MWTPPRWISTNGPTRVEYVRPLATLHDATGMVIGCGSTYVEGTHLDPGQESPFKITFSGRDYADAAAYRIQVDGMRSKPLMRPTDQVRRE